ncbi:cytidylyltransferase domain-containing protein [Paenibacillus sp. WLX2291]|uniref:acylneuraminate cytidylyltransferase family protein n=1 Tax=Paenibacillus sp. WLX2291 TaxID=3296934 RepID=UPI0039840385
MKQSPSCLAIIPARGGSKGLPGKNLIPLCGKPLIQYTIEAALQSNCIKEIVVSTDDEKIAKVAQQAGATVPFIRPAELATDEAKSIDVMIHAVKYYEQTLQKVFDYIVLLQPTSPLRSAQDIDQAFIDFQYYNADSLQSVSLCDHHPYLLREMNDGVLYPYLHQEPSHLRRQDLQQVYMLNGAIYIMKRDLLMNNYQIIGKSNYGYIMPKRNSVDIDDIWDLKWAELILEQNENI